MTNNLQHIAIIMDGNGRWAKAKGLPRTSGHAQGAETLQKIASSAADLGITYLTVYAFSTENWQRPQEEVDYLMGLLRQYLKKEFKEIQERGARIRFIGERSMLDADIISQMDKIERDTQANDKLTLCIALSYGSRQEIASTFKKLSTEVAQGKLKLEDITEQYISQRLYTTDMPDPDIIIRTGGEQRLSNFLLWQAAYSELFFTKTYWPDFSPSELKDIINQYNSRERRYGKV